MLFAFIIATAVLALSAPLLGRLLGRNAGWVLAIGLAATGTVLWATSGAGPETVSVPWIPTLGIELAFRLDGLSLLFSLLVLLIGAAVFAYSARYLPKGRHGSFYALMTLFALAMLGLVLADDVVVLFVMWEITTLCSFFLIARSGATAREPAIRTLLVTAAGGLSLLAAVVVMAVNVGSTRLSVILADPIWDDPTFAATAGVLLAVAAFTKSAQFPFQAWLPDSMAAITPVSAYLHAAAMVKAGIYLLMRFSGVLGDVPIWNILLISVGLITAILGAVAALRRYDMKELLAYSTVSQLGLLVAVIGVGTPGALIAASIHTVAHALFKSALFMLVGVVDHTAHTRDIRKLSGLRHTMPVTTALIGAAALSMAGVPPLLGFISKESIFEALLDAPGPVWVGPVAAAGAVLAAVFTFAYAARLVLGAFAGPSLSDPPREASAAMLLPIVPTAIAGVLLGFLPMPLEALVSDAGSAAVGVDTVADLALWHGVNTALILSAFVIAVGVMLVLYRQRIENLTRTWDFPFSALAVVDGLRAGAIAGGARVGDLTRSDSPTRHLLIPTVMLVGIAAAGTLSVGVLPNQVGDLTRPFDWVLVAALLVGVLGSILARTRLGAIAIIGLVGFAVTIWFYVLGAADVALTQLLVEVLTVVVMVLLLSRLPTTFRRASPRRAFGSGAIAIAFGVATTLGVLAFTGRRELSEAGAYFVREAESATGGTNIVNTILVDFRAFDTLGEQTVLGVAAVAILALLQSRDLLPKRRTPIIADSRSPLRNTHDNAVFGRAFTRLLGPLIVIISLLFLFRGHNAAGGGFIAALIGGAGFALLYLTASSDAAARIRLPYMLMIGSGILIGVITGIFGYAEGSFLTPLHVDILGAHLTTALVFDVGVYLTVIGVVLASLNLLGRSAPTNSDLSPRPEPLTPARRTSEKELS
ncbi:MAG: DUF4040 family protein [Cryobacterium sp.]